MSDNWIVENLENAFNTWNSKLSELWTLVTQSPEDFRGGTVWQIMVQIHGALQATAYGLLVLFFVIGVMKTAGSFAELKRPEMGIKMFIRFVLAKAAIDYGMELMLALQHIVQGIITTVTSVAGINTKAQTVLPAEIITAIEDCGWFDSVLLWIVTLLGSLLVTVLSFVMILTVYGRFFKLYMYTAIAPIAFSSFAGEPTQSMGRSFLKSYGGVCMGGVSIILACIISSALISASPEIDATASAGVMVWNYLAEQIFYMLTLVGTVKLSDRMMHEMMGL